MRPLLLLALVPAVTLAQPKADPDAPRLVVDSGGHSWASEDDLVRDLVSEDHGVAVLCSSRATEVSAEGGAVKQGFFTQALVEGLSGQADYNKDGVILFGELDRYTRLRVSALSRGFQHPTTAKPATLRSFPLAKP